MFSLVVLVECLHSSLSLSALSAALCLLAFYAAAFQQKVCIDRMPIHPVADLFVLISFIAATINLSKYGKVWALAKGPYGRTFAICWSQGSNAVIVDVADPSIHWTLPNSTNLWPHDFVIGPAALPLTGTGDRLLAVYITPLCDGCGAIQKYILFPQSFGPPDKALPPPVVVPATPQDRPVLAHLHVGHQGLVHPAQQAAAAAAIRAQEGDEAPTVEPELAADQISEEGEEEEEQEEEKVEQQEQAEDETEVKELQDPQTVEELQEKLADLQMQLQQYQDEEDDADGYLNLQSSNKFGAASRGWGSMGLVGFLSLIIGVGVGAAAVHFFTSESSRGRAGYTQVQQSQQNGVHHTTQPQQRREQSIDEMLREDDLELSLERNRLLQSGGVASR